MGVLADRLAIPSRTGAMPSWPQLVAALPDDAIADLVSALANPTIPAAQIKRAVEELYPDVPERSAGTWRNWRTLHLAGKLV